VKKPSKYCTFYLGELYLGLDVFQVQEVLRSQQPTPIALSPDCVNGLINLRGAIVTAMDLNVILGLPPRSAAGPSCNIIVNNEGELASFTVDSAGDVLEPGESLWAPVPDNVPEAIRRTTKGVYRLDGRLLLILDLHACLSTGLENQVATAA